MSSEWYLNTKMDRFSGYEIDEFNDEVDGLFVELLSHSPEAYDVTVNGLTKRVIIQSDSDENKRVLLSKIDDIGHGDLVVHKGDNWLVINRPEDDKINDHSEMRLCNSTLTIPGDTTKTQTGTDGMGRPIYDETTSPSTTLPCIAESKVYMSQDQEPINLPNGRLVVTVPYTNNDKVKLNFKFDMYGNSYEVSHVDRSQVIGTKGILQLTADLAQGG